MNGDFKIMLDQCPSDSCRAAMARTGATGYVFVSENAAPEIATTGVISDYGPIVAEVDRQLKLDPTLTHGVLDFEKWGSLLDEGPSDPRYAPTVASQLALLAKVKKRFPEIRWAYYGGAALEMYSPPGPTKDLTTKRPASARWQMIAESIANYRPVLEACDWTMPCIYLVHGVVTAADALREMRYRKLRITATMGCAPGKPCIPAICPYFAPGGNRSEHVMMNKEEFALTQVISALDNDCDGVALWTGFDYYRSLALRADDPQGVREQIRTAYQLNWGAGCLQSEQSLRAAQGKALAVRLDAAFDIAADRRPRLVGDVNRDGKVDAKDLAEVTGNWGSTG